MKMPDLTIALPLALIAAPAFAGTFQPPAGCQTYLTVQAQGCMVSQFYTCQGDAAGEQWRADYSADGPSFLSKIDREAQWLESYESNPETKETLDSGAADPASFSDLLANGLDTFDFSLTKSDGSHSRVVGFDKLTGESATIDGVTLQRTQYEYTQTDDAGNVLRHSKGAEYVSSEWRTFLSGVSEWEQEDGTWLPFENAPVKIIQPGQPGFQSTIPLFDCDAQMSSLTQHPGGWVAQLQSIALRH